MAYPSWSNSLDSFRANQADFCLQRFKIIENKTYLRVDY
jgi:hypothetical protein